MLKLAAASTNAAAGAAPTMPLVQVINVVYDSAPPTGAPSGGLGLISSPSPAAPAPLPAAPVQSPPSTPAVSSQQKSSPAPTSSGPIKYTGFGSDNTSKSGPDHKPLASYFTNTPAAAPAVAASAHAQSTAAAPSGQASFCVVFYSFPSRPLALHAHAQSRTPDYSSGTLTDIGREFCGMVCIYVYRQGRILQVSGNSAADCRHDVWDDG